VLQPASGVDAEYDDSLFEVCWRTPARSIPRIFSENKNVIVSRSAFLRVCGAALVGSSLPRWAFAGSSASAGGAETGAAGFRPHLGSFFTVAGTGQQLRLSTITESSVSPNVDQYALNFTAPAGSSIREGIYTLRHSALGPIEMFIAPVGAPGPLTTWQACFSRIVAAKEPSCRIRT
jgi:hypothetical protein